MVGEGKKKKEPPAFNKPVKIALWKEGGRENMGRVKQKVVHDEKGVMDRCKSVK